MRPWTPIPIDGRMYLNVKEGSLTRALATVENAFVNDAGGHSRFPGLKSFADLPTPGRVYLFDWRDNLLASTSLGRLYRINAGGQWEDVTGVPITGGRRAIFAKTDKEVVIAAGGPLVKFAGEKTEVLSEDAPQSTHVAYIDSYVVAIETDSHRFHHSNPGDPTTWDALDVFSADGKPDTANSLLVTPFRELIVGGEDSIEQFERLASGEVPFYRRWAVGEGMFAPYAVVAADNAVWTINRLREFVRFTGQSGQPQGIDIGRILESADDWTDAWIGGFPDKPLNVVGQKFVLLQLPNATNTAGTKGLTFIYDYRRRKWALLYGWDPVTATPARWPGWSHWSLWGRTFVGCDGKVCEVTIDNYSHEGAAQPMVGRTAHFSNDGETRIDNIRMRIERGLGGNTSAPTIRLRARRDNRHWSRWVERSLGRAGDTEMFVEFGGFGTGKTWQFEWRITDDCSVDIAVLEAQMARAGH